MTQIDNPIKYCIDCGCGLIVGANWTEASQSISQYICKSCRSKRSATWGDTHPGYSAKIVREWRIVNPEKNKAIAKKYNQSEKGKTCRNKWKDANPDYIKEYMKEYMREYMKKYRQTPKGKESKHKLRAKRRGYDSIKLFDNPFPEDIQVDMHHISDGFVVYIPRSLHLNHLYGNKKQMHRDELQPYVECIYNISYIIKERS